MFWWEKEELYYFVRKTKLVVGLKGNGQNPSISPQNNDQTSSFSLDNYDKGEQGFESKGYFLITGESIKKSEMQEKFVFRHPFFHKRISLE